MILPRVHDAITPFLFFTGKGGVGKTSLACATAVGLADRGKRVLLVSTDPASNLDEMLGVTLSDAPSPVPGASGLSASNIDPEAAAETYRERVLAQLDPGASSGWGKRTLREGAEVRRGRAKRRCSRAYAGTARKRGRFPSGLDFHLERGSGGPHRQDERLHPEDGDHPLQIVGENVKAHLRADLFEGAQPEVGRSHPRLDGSKRMFSGLASGAHGPGRAFQPLLHRVEDGFVLPTLDAPFLCRRALRFQRAGDAFRRPVVMQLSPCSTLERDLLWLNRWGIHKATQSQIQGAGWDWRPA